MNGEENRRGKGYKDEWCFIQIGPFLKFKKLEDISF